MNRSTGMFMFTYMNIEKHQIIENVFWSTLEFQLEWHYLYKIRRLTQKGENKITGKMYITEKEFIKSSILTISN